MTDDLDLSDSTLIGPAGSPASTASTPSGVEDIDLSDSTLVNPYPLQPDAFRKAPVYPVPLEGNPYGALDEAGKQRVQKFTQGPPQQINGRWYVKSNQGVVYNTKDWTPTDDPTVLQGFNGARPSKRTKALIQASPPVGMAPDQQAQFDAMFPGATAPATPPQGNEFTHGFYRGAVQGNLKMAGGTLKSLGTKFQSPALYEIGASAQRSADASQALPASVEWKNVHTPSEFGTWFAGQMGESLGSTMPGVLGAGAGAFMGRRAGRIGQMIGGAVGGFGMSELMNIGDMRQSLIDEGIKETPENEARLADISIKAGSAMAALDTALPERMVGVFTKPARDAFIKRVAKEALKGGLIEGSTEATQNAVIQYVAAKQAAGKPIDYGEMGSIAAQSFIAAAPIGAVGGGVSAAFQKPEPPPTEPIEPNLFHPNGGVPPPSPPPGPGATAPPSVGPQAPPQPPPPGAAAAPEPPITITTSEGVYPPTPHAARQERTQVDVEHPEIDLSDSTPIYGDGTRVSPAQVQTPEDIQRARDEIVEPTPAQARAENSKAGHVNIQGLPVTVETAKGGVRTGYNDDGSVRYQSPPLPFDYGRLKGIKGPDGSGIDVAIGDNPQAPDAFIIEQINPDTRNFDEPKVFVSVDSIDEAVNLYAQSFSDGRGLDRIGNVFPVPVRDVKKLLKERYGSLALPAPQAQEETYAQEPQQAPPQEAPQEAPAQIPQQPDLLPDQDLGRTVDEQGRVRIRWRNPGFPEEVPSSPALSPEPVIPTDQAGRDSAFGGGGVTNIGAQSSVPRPQTLAQFIIANGGIAPESGRGETRDYLHLIRNGGRTLDDLRERAAEAGFIPRGTDVNDLLDALAQDQRSGSQRVYSQADEATAGTLTPGQVEFRNRRALTGLSPVERGIYERHGEVVLHSLKEAFRQSETEANQWAPEHIDRAAIYIERGMDAGDALERAAIQHYGEEEGERDVNGETVTPESAQPEPEGEEIPFAEAASVSPARGESISAARKAFPEPRERATPDYGQKPTAGELPREGSLQQEQPTPVERVQQQKAPKPLEEKTEAGTQAVLPGAEKAPQKSQAQRLAEAPLKAKKAQTFDTGDLALFGDQRNQQDLLDIIKKQIAPAPPFFSALTRAVEGFKQSKANPAQWMGMIRNAQGVKPEEINWSTVQDWLAAQKGPVTKEALVDFLKANEVKIEEVRYGGPSLEDIGPDEQAQREHKEEWDRLAFEAKKTQNAWLQARRDYDARKITVKEYSAAENANHYVEAAWDRLHAQMVEETKARLGEEYSGRSGKFSQYQLPGGKNYRELVITLPRKAPTEMSERIRKLAKARTDASNALEAYRETPDYQEQPEYRRLVAARNRADDAFNDAAREEAGPRFEGSHFPESNVVVHVRFNERIDADGKRTLFIEEIQSDWHQKGRKSGYRRNPIELPPLPEGSGPRMRSSTQGSLIVPYLGLELSFAIPWNPTSGLDIAAAEREAREYLRIQEANTSRVPDAPFKTTWHELALKRMIRWAAEHGYDRVAWTPGSVQAERYPDELRQRVKSITWGDMTPNRKLKRIVTDTAEGSPIIVTINEQGVVTNTLHADLMDKPIEDIFGKEMAQQIMEQDVGKLMPENFTIGGKFHKLLYDKLLVDAANKIGKRFGIKVGTSNIATSSEFTPTGAGVFENTPPEFRRASANVVKAHSIDITDAMRESVMQGQAIFQRGRAEGYYQDIKRPVDFFPLNERKRNELHVQIYSLAKQILGHDLGIEFIIKERFEDPRQGGEYRQRFSSRSKAVVLRKLTVALQSFSKTGPLGSFRHEAIHALRELGAFTNQEWRLLAHMADKRWRQEYSIDENYPSASEELKTEEAVAAAFAEHRAGKRTGSMPDYIFEKLRKFMEAVANLFQGYGFQTQEGLFSRIEEGAVAERFRSRGRQTSYTPEHYQYPETAVQQRTPEPPGRALLPTARQGATQGPGRPGPPRRGGTNLPAVTPSTGSWEPPKRWRNSGEVWRNYNLSLFARLTGTVDAFTSEARRLFEDRTVPLIRYQLAIERGTGASVSDIQNAHMHAALFHGRAGHRLEDLRVERVEPLIKAMALRQVTLDELGDFLLARHASERNAEIARDIVFNRGLSYNRIINHPFVRALSDPDIKGGSSMSTNEILAFFNRYRNNPDKFRHLKSIAENHVDPMVRETRRRLREYGLISQDEEKRLTDQYKWYVSLQGFGDPVVDEEEDHWPRMGSRFSVSGPEYKSAKGRTSKPENPLLNTLSQAQQAIVRGEKNLVAQSFARLVAAHPNPNVWRLETPTQALPPSARRAEHEITAKFNGKEFVVVTRPGHTDLAKAMKGLGSEAGNAIVHAVNVLGNWFASSVTVFSPEFGLTNLLKDLGTASIHLTEIQVRGLKRNIWKSLPKAIMGAYRYQRGDRNSAWAQNYKEFGEAGGRVAFHDWKSLDEQRAELDKLLKLAGGQGPVISSRKILRAIGKFIKDYNTGIEQGIRLSAFYHMKQAGIPEKQVAYFTRRMTVDFQRKGELGPWVNAFYRFFNAALGGSVRATQYIYRNPKLAGKVLAGIVIFGAVRDTLNRMLSDDDEDKRSLYDKIPDWKRNQNMVFMLPGHQPQFTPPMPWIYNGFDVMGQEISRVAWGIHSPMTAAWNVVTTFANAYNPIGQMNSDLTHLLMPTFVQPLADILVGKDFTGKPLYRREELDDPLMPHSQMRGYDASKGSQKVAEGLNWITGGSDTRKGFVDISPVAIDRWVGFYGGGPWNLAKNAWTSTSKTWSWMMGKGELPETYEIPFARRLLTSKSRYVDRDIYYAIVDQVKIAETELKKSKTDERGSQRWQTTRKDYPVTSNPKLMATVLGYKDSDGKKIPGTETLLQRLRKQKREILAADKKLTEDQQRERVEKIEKKMDQLMLEVRKLYYETQIKKGVYRPERPTGGTE